MEKIALLFALTVISLTSLAQDQNVNTESSDKNGQGLFVYSEIDIELGWQQSLIERLGPSQKYAGQPSAALSFSGFFSDCFFGTLRIAPFVAHATAHRDGIFRDRNRNVEAAALVGYAPVPILLLSAGAGYSYGLAHHWREGANHWVKGVNLLNSAFACVAVEYRFATSAGFRVSGVRYFDEGHAFLFSLTLDCRSMWRSVRRFVTGR